MGRDSYIPFDSFAAFGDALESFGDSEACEESLAFGSRSPCVDVDDAEVDSDDAAGGYEVGKIGVDAFGDGNGESCGDVDVDGQLEACWNDQVDSSCACHWERLEPVYSSSDLLASEAHCKCYCNERCRYFRSFVHFYPDHCLFLFQFCFFYFWILD